MTIFHTYFRVLSIGDLTESKRKVADLFSEIVGILSIRRFQPIAELFVHGITLSTATKMEAVNLIRGMKCFKLHLSRVDSLNHTSNFLKRILDFYQKTKKPEIRLAVCEAGASMLSPLAAYDYKSGIDYREWFDILNGFFSTTARYAKRNKYQLVSTPECWQFQIVVFIIPLPLIPHMSISCSV